MPEKLRSKRKILLRSLRNLKIDILQLIIRPCLETRWEKKNHNHKLYPINNNNEVFIKTILHLTIYKQRFFLALPHCSSPSQDPKSPIAGRQRPKCIFTISKTPLQNQGQDKTTIIKSDFSIWYYRNNKNLTDNYVTVDLVPEKLWSNRKILIRYLRNL